MMRFFLPTLIVAIVAASTAARADLTHHWTFDEGTGVTAADTGTVGGATGTILDGAWASDATRASFLSFNGSTTSVDPGLTFPVVTDTSSFSWAAWVNNGAGNVNDIIIGNRRDGNGADFVPRQFIKLTVTQAEWHQNENGNDNVAYGASPIALDQWVHLAFVKDGTSLQIYENGLATNSGTLTESLLSSVPLPFFIGGEPGQGAGEHFAGGIDDVRIYNNALSASEVGALVSAVPEPGSFAVLGVAAVGMLVRRRQRTA